MGAPKGNKNASKKNREWGDALRMALAQSGGHERLRRIAESLLSKAEEGDISALRELGDRLDGKAVQPIAGGDGDEINIIHRIERVIIGGRTPDQDS